MRSDDDPTEQEIRAWLETNPLPTLEDRYWDAWYGIYLDGHAVWDARCRGKSLKYRATASELRRDKA